MREFDCLIIGAGPCGIATAQGLVGSDLSFAIVENNMPGGKVNIAPRVDNYPGYDKIAGPDLAMAFYQRIIDYHIELISDVINKLTSENNQFILEGKYDNYVAKTVVVASGTKEKKLNLPLEDKLFGHGLSYCALCDGHFFKDQSVVLIGEDDSALKEALYLADLASHLYIINSQSSFSGNPRNLQALQAKENVSILTRYMPKQLLGEEKVEGIVLKHLENDEEITISCQGIFPAIGQIPNTKFIGIKGITDANGNIPVNRDLSTSLPGLFAGGDVLPRDIRQIYLAEHDGKTIAKSVIEFLKDK